jgi:hypothetical protein
MELNPDFNVTMDPTEVKLGSLENGTTYMVVKVPPMPPKKTYFFSVEITSSSPELSPVTKSVAIEVGQAYGMEATCEEPRRKTIPGGNLEFEVTVRNTGNGLDSIVVRDIEGVPDGWLTYTQPPEVTLLQDQTAIIKVVVLVSTHYEDAFRRTYDLTIPFESSRSDAVGETHLFVDLAQVWRIEWALRDEELTNPDRPTSQPGEVRPKPEIDLYIGTSTFVTLELWNLGNGEDNVTIWTHVEDDRIGATATPSGAHLQWGHQLEVTLDITVPDNMTPGTHTVWINATSEDQSLKPRAVNVIFEVIPVLYPTDFANLTYTDTFGDDYTYVYRTEGEDKTVVSAKGRRGAEIDMDILSLSAFFDPETNLVTITLELRGSPDYGPGTEYNVVFVNENHRAGGDLRFPQQHTEGDYEWSSFDILNTTTPIWVAAGELGSFVPMDNLQVQVLAAKLIFTVPARELRYAGVRTGNELHMYAYCHRLGGEGDENSITWDTAGKGSYPAPSEFTKEEEGSSSSGLLAVIVLAVLVLAVVAAFLMFRNKGHGEEPEDDASEWIEYE